MPTTFQSRSLKDRWRTTRRKVARLQYPLSDLSETNTHGSSISASTRRSNSSWRRGSTDVVDVIVVDTQAAGVEEVQIQVQEEAHFFEPKFSDAATERRFRKESWFLAKRRALITSLFFYVVWGLIIGLTTRPWFTYDYICWIGVSGALVIPLFPAVLFDAPQHWAFQPYLLCLSYMWPLLFAIQLLRCNFYGNNTCAGKDFVGLFYYLCALPTICLLSLNQKRITHLIGTLAALLFIAIALIPRRRTWIRHFFNYLIFQGFMLYVSYAREKAERKVFLLKEQLKSQYKATQKAQAAETRASDSKKRFINYIFHEVRVPLNTALLSMQNLQGEEAFSDIKSEHEELVEVMRSSLIMMQQVLNDVLDFNKMESGKLAVVTEPFDIGKVMQSVFKGLSVAASAKSINLASELSLPDNLVMGDEMRLRQVLTNLTSNACKFTSEGGDISLKATMIKSDERSVTIRIEVIDTGVGIRNQDLRKDLFSPYVQTEIGKRQGGKGTGLGLALVRSIVQLSGGRLGLKSVYNKGSTFWIEQDYLFSTEQLTDDSTAVSNSVSLHILIVDDDLITRRLMSRMITRLGHTTELAENGETGLKLLRTQTFDLVFLDNQMPILSGVEMTTLARLEGIETMICGVTGNAMKEDQDEYLDAGADIILTKPVMESDIRKAIEVALSRKS